MPLRAYKRDSQHDGYVTGNCLVCGSEDLELMTVVRKGALCTKCGCIFQDRGNSDTVSLQTNENYSISALHGLGRRFFPSKMECLLSSLDLLLENKPQPTKLNILDLGCGEGLFLDFFKKRVRQDTRFKGIALKMVGVDVNAPHVSNDAEITYHRSSVLGDYNNNWAVDGEYDIIFLFDFVEHVYEQKELFYLVSRLVKRRGLVIVETADIAHWYARLTKYNYYYTALSDHVFFHSTKSLQIISESMGLKVLDARRIYHRNERFSEYLLNIFKSMAHLVLIKVPFFLFPFKYFPKGYGLKDHLVVLLQRI